MAYNYVTKQEYTGKNAQILEMTNVKRVCTFKQALSLPGVSGKTMKGLKSIATLVRYSKNENEDGSVSARPFFFNVFDADQILSRVS